MGPTAATGRPPGVWVAVPGSGRLRAPLRGVALAPLRPSPAPSPLRPAASLPRGRKAPGGVRRSGGPPRPCPHLAPPPALRALGLARARPPRKGAGLRPRLGGSAPAPGAGAESVLTFEALCAIIILARREKSRGPRPIPGGALFCALGASRPSGGVLPTPPRPSSRWEEGCARRKRLRRADRQSPERPNICSILRPSAWQTGGRAGCAASRLFFGPPPPQEKHCGGGDCSTNATKPLSFCCVRRGQQSEGRLSRGSPGDN